MSLATLTTNAFRDVGYWALHGEGSLANRSLLSFFGYDDLYDQAVEVIDNLQDQFGGDAYYQEEGDDESSQ